MRIQPNDLCVKTLIEQVNSNASIRKTLRVFVRGYGKTAFTVHRISETEHTRNFNEASFPTYEEAVENWNSDESDNLAP